MTMTILTCPNCESTSLRWHIDKTCPAHIVDGRLKLNEIGVMAYLGCEECSETLAWMREDEIEEALNGPRKAAKP